MLTQLWHDLWIAFFVVLVLIGLFAGHGLVIGFGVMGLLVAAISWLWNKVSLEDVSYERHLSQHRVFIGDEVSMTVALTNRKPVPLSRIDVEDDLPEELKILDADVIASPDPHMRTLRQSTSMQWYERIRWNYRVKATKRGFYRIGPARIRSGDMFGFFTSRKSIRDQDHLLVYPKVVPLADLGLPAARPLGETGGGIRIYQDPSRPAGIREYQHGDPLNVVDWKATARTQKLQVKTFEPSSTFTVILVVVVETAERSWQGFSSTHLERVVTAAASVATYVTEKRYTLGMFSNGVQIMADRPMRIAPSSSPEQLTVVLETLATIQPLGMSPMGGRLADQVGRFPVGATLVVIAAMVQLELVEAIGRARNEAHPVTMLYVGDGRCPDMPERVVVHELREHFERMELASEYGPR